ncbi:MAG: hypothetical protein IKH04_08280 [Kiritimatiellae bacterium]|nr:hypothetical protein [Kiritimatiellia bacterium]
MTTILYLNISPGDSIHALTLAGIRRYAATLGWVAATVLESETRPESLEALFREHAPVAGCIVECAGLHAGFPPRLFGKTPVVYLHAPPTLHGGAGARIHWDGAAKYAWSGYGAAYAGDRRARAALLSMCFGNAGAAEKWRAYVSRLEMETVEDGGEAAQDGGEGQAPGRDGNAVVRIRLEDMRKRDRNISRGIAFGSKEYVKARIGEFSQPGRARTKPISFGTGERSTPLFCAGKRSA